MDGIAELLKAFEVLGGKVVALENDKSYERVMKEEYKQKADALAKENAQLRSKLDEVKAFIKAAEVQ